MGNVIML